MSYDLMVFNPNKAPKSKSEFMNWYENQTEWEEEHDYDDPKVSSEELKNWFLEMIKEFPAMNGPFASDDVDDPKVTDYSVGMDVIYAAFAWSEAENAYPKMVELAEKHKVGFFDASGSGDILIPNENGEFENLSKGSSSNKP
jgi:hypothetical protein